MRTYPYRNIGYWTFAGLLEPDVEHIGLVGGGEATHQAAPELRQAGEDDNPCLKKLILFF